MNQRGPARPSVGERRPEAVGVLAPPANPTVGAEFRAWLPSLALDVETLPTVEGDLRHRLAGYADRLGEPVTDLRSRGVSAALLACTGCSYGLGMAGDRALARDAGRRLGAPFLTAAGAVARVLELVGATTITLVSPYPDWLTEQSVAYWTAAGIQVGHVHPIPGTGAIYDLGDDAVLAAVDAALDTALDVRASDGGAHGAGRPALLITGTGAPTRRALDRRAESATIPLISSNLAGVWCLLEALGRTALAQGSASKALATLDERITSAATADDERPR